MTNDHPDTPDNSSDTAEVIYFEGSPALRGSLGSVCLNVVIGVAILVAALAFRAQGGWILPAGILIAAILPAIPIFIARSVRYRISSYRIDFERGVFSKDIDTLELWHVEDIKFHQSLLDRILHIGTLTVISHDETTPCLPLRALPAPRPIFETLKQRIITVKRQRGVIKLDAG